MAKIIFFVLITWPLAGFFAMCSVWVLGKWFRCYPRGHPRNGGIKSYLIWGYISLLEIVLFAPLIIFFHKEIDSKGVKLPAQEIGKKIEE